jgi:hypothetical protein
MCDKGQMFRVCLHAPGCGVVADPRLCGVPHGQFSGDRRASRTLGTQTCVLVVAVGAVSEVKLDWLTPVEAAAQVRIGSYQHK